MTSLADKKSKIFIPLYIVVYNAWNTVYVIFTIDLEKREMYTEVKLVTGGIL